MRPQVNRAFIFWSTLAAVGLVSGSARAEEMYIRSAHPNVAAGQLVIDGSDFKPGLRVWLDFTELQVLSVTPAEVKTKLPKLPYGTYRLILDSKRDRPHSFIVSIGGSDGSGTPGPAGPQGPAGPAGPPGLAGPMGPQGPAGPKGATGANGPAGPSGPAGPAGATGAAGLMGSAGPIGPAGPAGGIGPMGPAGGVGPMGPQGAIGLTGPAGPAGPTGPAGVQGLQGLQGLPGAAGQPGQLGLQGPKGDQGPMGPQGPAGGGLMLFSATNQQVGVMDGIAGGSPAAVRKVNGVWLAFPVDAVGLIPMSFTYAFYTQPGCAGTAYTFVDAPFRLVQTITRGDTTGFYAGNPAAPQTFLSFKLLSDVNNPSPAVCTTIDPMNPSDPNLGWSGPFYAGPLSTIDLSNLQGPYTVQ